VDKKPLQLTPIARFHAVTKNLLVPLDEQQVLGDSMESRYRGELERFLIH
jgi:hypothetical protein